MNNLAEPIQNPAIDRTKSDFLLAVLEGLSEPPRSLPCKYFYDARGSQLFEQICQLPEYYITRTELALLADIGQQVADQVGEGVSIVEPGAGAGQKVQVLLQALLHPRKFIPLEISLQALESSTRELQKKFPRLEVIPHQGDFTDQKDLTKLPLVTEDDDRRLVFFPGSTIGNFTRDEAIKVLGNLAVLAGSTGWVLVGVDLLKDRQRLLAAYNDSQGITADFNKNLLLRINTELGGDFDLEKGFAHQASFNESASRIEMHLQSLCDQQVSVAGRQFSFCQGETIHTENSHKYSQAMFSEMAGLAGLDVCQSWTDQNQDFALFLLVPSSR